MKFDNVWCCTKTKKLLLWSILICVPCPGSLQFDDSVDMREFV